MDKDIYTERLGQRATEDGPAVLNNCSQLGTTLQVVLVWRGVWLCYHLGYYQVTTKPPDMQIPSDWQSMLGSMSHQPYTG